MENEKVNIFEWENWDKLSTETAQFILSQAEKELNELVVAADVLTQRASSGKPGACVVFVRMSTIYIP